MRCLAVLFLLACWFPIDVVAEDEPAYINYDRGWVRDPYAGPMGEKESFDSVEDAIELVSSANSFEGEAIGYSHQRSSLYAAHEYLAQEASEEQLMTLVNSKNPVAKCYSIMALTDRLTQAQIGELAEDLVLDHEEFSTMHYDMGSSSTVADCMIESWYSKMTQERKDSIATYLLTERPRLMVMQQLLFFWPLSEEHYSLVKGMYEEDIRLAPVALAGFQKESDLPILREEIAEEEFIGLHIISRFPHDSFLPILEEMLEQEIRKNVYFSSLDRVFGALLAYPDDVVLETLNPYLDGDKGEIDDLPDKASNLFYYLGQLPPERHLDLRLKLFDKWHGITPDGLKVLLEHDSDAVAGIAVDILGGEPDPDGRLSFELDIIYVFDELLTIVEEHRSDELPRVLINATARSDINTLPSTARMLIKHKPEGSVDVLLYLIREVQQPSYLARAIGTLESIDTSALSVDVLKQRTYLDEPWENWKGDNCHKMIDYHVSREDLRETLKQRCRPE